MLLVNNKVTDSGTSASVGHDCVIGAHVHIAASATSCSGVQVEQSAFIGARVVLAQGLNIGNGSVIGNAVTLTQSLGCGLVVIGAANRLKSQLN